MNLHLVGAQLKNKLQSLTDINVQINSISVVYGRLPLPHPGAPSHARLQESVPRGRPTGCVGPAARQINLEALPGVRDLAGTELHWAAPRPSSGRRALGMTP